MLIRVALKYFKVNCAWAARKDGRAGKEGRVAGINWFGQADK